MRIASIVLRGAAVLAVVAAGSPAARAGKITAKAGITFCAVQAVDCLDDSRDSCQLIFNSALAAGEAIISETGSLCYRRNIKPDDCSSALQPEWSCIVNFAAAPKMDAIR